MNGENRMETVHGLVWGPAMLLAFLLVGIRYSVRLRGFQLLGFFHWWKTTAGSIGRNLREKTERAGEKEKISQLQSACTALAATIGTGNITGVATALLAGGPGAIFWMWVSAFLGMATAYGETELGIRYRRREREGGWLSGPMLYLEKGLQCRPLGILYAFLCVTASFGMGSMVQANAISESLGFAFSMPAVAVGMLLTVLVGKILLGGALGIAKTAEKLVPVSAAIYLAASAGVLFVYRENILPALGLIIKDACSFDSVAGGAAGFGVSRAMRYGIARGVFSNEAGLGSMAVLNGGVEETRPGIQGQWAMFEVFFDTIVSCTVTALVILCVMGAQVGMFSGNGADLTGFCFEAGLGNLGGYAVSVCVVLFAFATIIAWYYMGKQSAAYLGETLGKDLGSPYLCFYLAAVFVGSLGPMEAVWELSDILNGLMAVPNLLALAVLSGQISRPAPAVHS